jgi:Holliday junction resolvase
MRRAAASDANQKQIVAALRAAGCMVIPCHAVGQGFPDLVVGYQGDTYLIEVKDPSQPKHRHELTPAQKLFHATWPGKPIAKVFTVIEALEAVGIQFRGSIT